MYYLAVHTKSDNGRAMILRGVSQHSCIDEARAEVAARRLRYEAAGRGATFTVLNESLTPVYAAGVVGNPAIGTNKRGRYSRAARGRV